MDAGFVRKMEREGRSFVSSSSAQATKDKIDAVKYKQCSALTREGLESIFREVVMFVNAQLRITYFCAKKPRTHPFPQKNTVAL